MSCFGGVRSKGLKRKVVEKSFACQRERTDERAEEKSFACQTERTDERAEEKSFACQREERRQMIEQKKREEKRKKFWSEQPCTEGEKRREGTRRDFARQEDI